MIYIPKHFSNSEFWNIKLMNPLTLYFIDTVRDAMGEITDFRFNTLSTNNPEDNHVKGSSHYDNRAVDYTISSKKLKKLTQNKKEADMFTLESLFSTLIKTRTSKMMGLGVYVNSKGYISYHTDYRSEPAKWMALGKNKNNEWNYVDFNYEKLKDHILTL